MIFPENRRRLFRVTLLKPGLRSPASNDPRRPPCGCKIEPEGLQAMSQSATLNFMIALSTARTLRHSWGFGFALPAALECLDDHVRTLEREE